MWCFLSVLPMFSAIEKELPPRPCQCGLPVEMIMDVTVEGAVEEQRSRCLLQLFLDFHRALVRLLFSQILRRR